MKKDLIFFSQNGEGLTSTSANHVANMAKEMIRSLTSEMAAMVFYSTDVALIGNSDTNRLVTGATDDDVLAVASKLRRISDAKSLIAWLREAIKAKERLLDEAKSQTLEEYAKAEGITLAPQPEQEQALTEDEYFAMKPLDERCRYYELETLASTLGKEIHPGGSFAEARDSFLSVAAKPHSVKGDGRDTLIYTYTGSVSPDVVEDVFFRLQKQYREAQARLNSLKFECQKAVTESEVKVRTDYAAAMADWNNERRLIQARHAEHVQRRVKHLGSLRIIIPESLREIFDEVSRLGKK